MHTLFQKLTGSSAIENLKKHIDDNHQAIEKLQEAASGARTINERCNQARLAFLKKQTPDALEEWMYSEGLRAGAHVVNQEISNHVTTTRIAHHVSGRAKIIAAYDEVEALLIKRRDEISRQDAERSAELGVPTSSDGALQLIARRAEQVSVGRQYIDADPVRAVASIGPFLK